MTLNINMTENWRALAAQFTSLQGEVTAFGRLYALAHPGIFRMVMALAAAEQDYANYAAAAGATREQASQALAAARRRQEAIARDLADEILWGPSIPLPDIYAVARERLARTLPDSSGRPRTVLDTDRSMGTAYARWAQRNGRP